MAYGSCRDLTKRTEPDKVLRDKAFKMVAIRYNSYERGLASIVYRFFDKNLLVVVINLHQFKNWRADELHKPIIRRLIFYFKDFW